MSKRFGRNQKRAMRKQIKDLQHTVHQKNTKNLDLRRDLDFANTVIERTAQVLGDHFVTLPVQTKEVKDLLDRFQVSIFQPDRHIDINSAAMQALSFIEMETWRGSVYFDDLRGMVHLRYAAQSGAAGYSLSELSWKKLSKEALIDKLKNQIAFDMAKLLVNNRKDHN